MGAAPRRWPRSAGRDRGHWSGSDCCFLLRALSAVCVPIAPAASTICRVSNIKSHSSCLKSLRHRLAARAAAHAPGQYDRGECCRGSPHGLRVRRHGGNTGGKERADRRRPADVRPPPGAVSGASRISSSRSGIYGVTSVSREVGDIHSTGASPTVRGSIHQRFHRPAAKKTRRGTRPPAAAAAAEN